MNFLTQKNKQEISKNQNQLSLIPVKNKKVELSFSGERISSDGGLLLLKEVEKQIGIIDSLCDGIKDTRDQRYVKHTLHTLLIQRIYQIAAGYEDANDCNFLNQDSIFKLCADKLPYSDEDLPTQPTMSRFENSVSKTDLYRIAECFLRTFRESYDEEPPVIIIDCDDTNNNTYGNQQLTLFNNYYGDYCYMPLHVYEGLSGKLITTILKPGRRSKSVNVFSVLSRIIRYLRQEWKNTRIIIRGDSHFCSSDFMDWAREQYKVNFITGLTGNQVLNRLSGTTIESAKSVYERSNKPVKFYHTFEYQASSWRYPQRVIVKVEVTSQRMNIRYIVTDLRDFRTRQLYENGYCARGQMELKIKEHKTFLKSNRSSCSKFEANQLRLFLHSAAYVLIHTLQKVMLRGTEYYNCTMKTIQLKILKTAAYVKETKTKIKIEFPYCCPTIEAQTKCFKIFEQLRFR
jgi:hypothetical protein